MHFSNLSMPFLPWRNPRALLAFLHDLIAAGAAWGMAFWLRFAPDWPAQFFALFWQGLPWVVLTQGLCCIGFGLYAGMWRFASLPDLKRILVAVGLGALVTPLVLLFVFPAVVLPRSVLILDPVLLIVLMGGSRLAYRAWKEHRLGALTHPGKRPAVILGAGSAADFFLRELRSTPALLRPVALLDDDPAKLGRRLQDVPVLGEIAKLPEIVRRTGAEVAVFAIPSASHTVKRRVAELAMVAGVELLTLPALEDVVAGRVTIQSLRGLELEDLLGRDPVQLDLPGLDAAIGGRTVLVTGGAGSIGAELVRQLAHFRPARLVLVDASEFGLYRMGEELAARFPDIDYDLIAADVRDARRMQTLFAHYRPSLVYHAAAYKHVPLMEEANALECLKNNVLGTWVAARAAIEAGVGKFVLVSTDKAVNPTNVMGASKRLAELVCQSLEGQGTHFVAVRFGNVLGSSGSVVPKFRSQIEAGGPVTVTHPEVVRYFMTIPEAAQLVLQAGLMGRGGEIFVLDMGEPVRIVDLARLMIRLAGKSEGEIPIIFTGLRPGEKLYEELLADDEHTLPTPHPRVRVAKAQGEWQCVEEAVAWIAATSSATAEEVRARLATWLPEYRPGGGAQAPRRDQGSENVGAAFAKPQHHNHGSV